MTAQQLSKELNITMNIKNVSYGKHFDSDTQSRYIFTIQLKSRNKSYTFKYGQSLANGDKEPTLYDVLSCLTKYDAGTFEDFCRGFGYDTDSRAAHKTYKAVCKEHNAMCRLFNEYELEQLAETFI